MVRGSRLARAVQTCERVSVRPSAMPWKSGNIGLRAMTVAITELPKIIKTLQVNETPYFFVILYDQFVKFVVAASETVVSASEIVVAASETKVPDVAAVLDFDKEHVFIIVGCGEFRSYVRRLDIAGNVDEEHYLNKYPDIKIAVDQGVLISGTHHYVEQGYFEGREAKFPPSNDEPKQERMLIRLRHTALHIVSVMLRPLRG
jgi:hypothetical protein